MEIKLLSPGDTVISVWKEEQGYGVAIKRFESQTIEIKRILLDENSIPRIKTSPLFVISFVSQHEQEEVTIKNGITLTTF